MKEEIINKTKTIKKITIIGMILNLLLAGIKLLVGYLGKSQAVIADAIHSLSDLSTDIAVIIGVKFWEPPPDEKHPYGHKKIETVITLVIGFILGFVGLEIILNAVKTLPDSHSQNPSLISVVGPLLSIIIKEILYHCTIIIGKKVKSSAVIANAWHHRSDALSSIPALIAVVISYIFPQFSFVDHIGAIIVAIFIFKVTWDICKPAFLDLIDSGANKKEIDEISNIALSTEGIQSIHKLRTRKVGGGYFIDLHIQVVGTLSVFEGHNISEKVKYNLLKNGPNVIDVLIHLEPTKG